MQYVIATIKQQRGRAGRLVFSFEPEREAVILSTDVAAEIPGLFRGAQVTDEQIQHWLWRDELYRCRQKAWALLALRPRSRLELSRALQKRKFSARAIGEVLSAMEAKGYLDDVAYARLMVEQARLAAKSGPRLVRQQLAAKGIKGEVAQQALEPVCDENAQHQAARKLMEKWNRRARPEDPNKRRIAAAGYLARRGFDADIVWQAVQDVLGENHDEQIDDEVMQ